MIISWGRAAVLQLELQTNVREVFTITEKDPTRAFSWLKAATIVFTLKALLRHYAKQALTPVSIREIGSPTQTL